MADISGAFKRDMNRAKVHDTKHPAEVLADKLAQRRVPRWTHATSQTPQQHGFVLDRECLEASDMLRRIPALEAERDRLRAEVEALRADAERYRWLRDTPGSFTVFAEACCDSMDEDVDAARKAAP